MGTEGLYDVQVVEKDAYVIQQGEHLAQVLRKVYGLSDEQIFREYIAVIKELNPEIKDPSRPGQKIRMPNPKDGPVRTEPQQQPVTPSPGEMAQGPSPPGAGQAPRLRNARSGCAASRPRPGTGQGVALCPRGPAGPGLEQRPAECAPKPCRPSGNRPPLHGRRRPRRLSQEPIAPSTVDPGPHDSAAGSKPERRRP